MNEPTMAELVFWALVPIAVFIGLYIKTKINAWCDKWNKELHRREIEMEELW